MRFRLAMIGVSVCITIAATSPLFATQQTRRASTTAPVDPALREKLARFGSRELPLHDPSAIVRCKNEYWLFSTGNGLHTFRSKDLRTWTHGPHPVIQPPAWVKDEVPANRGGHFWAPDVIEVDGRYLLYYSVSSWGKNHSCIALATNVTLDPEDPAFKWVDAGIVVRSKKGNDYNAIDPAVTLDKDGRLWMSFGSFWGGIQLIELDRKTGLRAADASVKQIAWHKEIEAPAIYRHDDDYYLFVTWGLCCRGVESTYNIRVGRSKSITGPYLDKDGVDLVKGGGTPVLAGAGPAAGPGHPSVFADANGELRLSFHFYDTTHEGRGTLAIRPVSWDAGGWPVIGEDSAEAP